MRRFSHFVCKRHLSNDFGSCTGAFLAMSIGYVNMLVENQAPVFVMAFSPAW
jgi:hypothetical protein